MLEMNLKCEINNLNYLRYMEHKGNGNGANRGHFESDKTTSAEEQEEKEK